MTKALRPHFGPCEPFAATTDEGKEWIGWQSKMTREVQVFAASHEPGGYAVFDDGDAIYAVAATIADVIMAAVGSLKAA